MADDDDLDDFFNEVEEAEEEAKAQFQNDKSTETEKQEKAETTVISSDTSPKVSGSDENGEDTRAVKKQKTEHASASSSTSTVTSTVTSTTTSYGPQITGAGINAATATPIIAVAATHNITTTSSSSNPLSVSNGSLLTSAPPPPPPPPLPPGPPPTQQLYNRNSSNYSNSYNYHSNYGVNMNVNVNVNVNGMPPHPPPPPPLPSSGQPPLQQTEAQAKKVMKRTAAGSSWVDPTLAEFPPNDFRLFIGNLAKDTQVHQLEQFFKADYPSFAMAKICYNKHDSKSKGYGFVSMLDPMDAARAVREKDQKWLGSRPIKVRMSDWKDRDAKTVKKRNQKMAKKGKKRLW